MEYTLIDPINKSCVGVVKNKPKHDNWTLIPYEGDLLKECFDIKTEKWVESATREEILEFKNLQIKALNEMQFEEMKIYDWYFTRKIRTNKEVPQEVLDELERIDNKYKELKRNL